MKITSAAFVISNTDYRKCPATDKPEYAFIGRSNVGKSSLINFLLNKKKLALTSSSPGKTQTINHFLVNDTFYLVDLPGYGYARRAQAAREQWRRLTWEYLQKRENLVTLFVLVDANIPPQENDLEFIGRLGAGRIPFVLVFTKTDKSKPSAVRKNLEAFTKAMLQEWEAVPPVFLSSAAQEKGKKELLDYIGRTMEDYYAYRAKG